VVRAPAGVAHVEPEGGLAVGSGRDDPVSASLLKSDGHEEARGQLAPVVLERRHGELDVLAEERDDRLDVASLLMPLFLDASDQVLCQRFAEHCRSGEVAPWLSARRAAAAREIPAWTRRC